MTYNKNKPDAGPSPAVDSAQIRENFSQYGTIFSNNHVALNSRNQGAHSQIIYEKQAADPGVSEDLAVLYAKDATSNTSTEPQLFAQIPKFLPNAYDNTPADNTGMQLTHNSVDVAGPSQYHSFLPGGYIYYFGSFSGNSVPGVMTSPTITLSPAPTEILSVIATPNTVVSVGDLSPFNVSVVVNTNDTFTIYSTANGSSPSIPYTFTYMVIAKS